MCTASTLTLVSVCLCVCRGVLSGGRCCPGGGCCRGGHVLSRRVVLCRGEVVDLWPPPPLPLPLWPCNLSHNAFSLTPTRAPEVDRCYAGGNKLTADVSIKGRLCRMNRPWTFFFRKIFNTKCCRKKHVIGNLLCVKKRSYEEETYWLVFDLLCSGCRKFNFSISCKWYHIHHFIKIRQFSTPLNAPQPYFRMICLVLSSQIKPTRTYINVLYLLYFRTIQVFSLSLLTRLESAYSLIWGAQRIWGQDLGTFMINRPI